MKILANDGISQNAIEILTKAGYNVITTKVSQNQLIDFINKEDIKILLVRSATQARKDLIDACPSLKLIGRGGVGMDNIDVKYTAYAKTNRWRAAKWQGEITNAGSGTNGYAGVIGQPLLALQAYTVGNADKVGKLMYRLRPIGSKSYWSWQTDKEKDKYGETWAGNKKTRYDGIQMHLSGGGDHQVRYRVYCKGKGWLSWITDYGDGADGYAGWRGYEIQAVQIEII